LTQQTAQRHAVAWSYDHLEGQQQRHRSRRQQLAQQPALAAFEASRDDLRWPVPG
jgi:hypothetical protein